MTSLKREGSLEMEVLNDKDPCALIKCALFYVLLNLSLRTGNQDLC